MGTARDFTAVGVDGCKGGWFYVAITPDGDFRSGVIDNLAELIDNDEPHNGFWERLGLLEMACTGVADAPRKLDTEVAVDDVLDATAAALTATADPAALRSLPAKPQQDAHPLPMQLLYTTREHVRGRP